MDDYVTNLLYERKFGSKEGTVNAHAGCMGCLAGLAGLVAGAYVTNEAMQWISADMPTVIRYAADAIGGLVAGKMTLKIGAAVGYVTGRAKVGAREDEIRKYTG